MNKVEEQDKMIHSDLPFLKVLSKYSFKRKIVICQKYLSRIMRCSEIDIQLVLKENIMSWELETFAAFSAVYNDEGFNTVINGKAFSRIIAGLHEFPV